MVVGVVGTILLGVFVTTQWGQGTSLEDGAATTPLLLVAEAIVLGLGRQEEFPR